MGWNHLNLVNVIFEWTRMVILVSPPSTKSASCAIEFRDRRGRHLSGPHLLEIADFRATYRIHRIRKTPPLQVAACSASPMRERSYFLINIVSQMSQWPNGACTKEG